MKEIRYALRGVRRSPTFSLTVLIVIALATGAATAVFSLVDRILFRAPPYPHGDRLVSYGLRAPVLPDEFLFGSAYQDFREHQPSRSGAASPIAT